ESPAARTGSVVKVNGGATLTGKPPGIGGKDGIAPRRGTTKELDLAKRRGKDEALRHCRGVGDARSMNPQTNVRIRHTEGVGTCARLENDRADVDVDDQNPCDTGRTKRRHIVDAVGNSAWHPIIRRKLVPGSGDRRRRPGRASGVSFR